MGHISIHIPHLLHRLGSTVIHEYADSSKDPLLIGSIGTGSNDNYIRLFDMIHCLLLIFVEISIKTR